MSFDFHPAHRDPLTFLHCVYAWALVEGEVFSVANMNEEELRRAVVEDILIATIWEKQSGKKLHFDLLALVRHIDTSEYRANILKLLDHDEIKGLIELDPVTYELRIRDNRAILQQAMSYSGVYFSGFDVDPGVSILSVDREEVANMIEKTGGIENMITSLMMDIPGFARTTPSVNIQVNSTTQLQ